MSSGTKAMVINTRERAVSTDINRLQAFQQAAIAEILRYMLLTTSSEAEAGGVAVTSAAAASPMPALIVAGFLCRPQVGSSDLFVDPGLMVVADADITPSSDDSIGKVVEDPAGVTTPGTLSFLANGGAMRVDIVEVARVDPSDPSTIVETANRDIYNPATGTFSATSVPKATDGKVQYRIRRGTSGGGWPGTAIGWLPLMVAFVPSTATNWDGVLCFDVRPLLADVEDGFVQNAEQMPTREDQLQIYGEDQLAASFPNNPIFIKGRCRTSCSWWKAGGEIPALVVNFPDIAASDVGFDLVNLWGETTTWFTALPSIDGGVSLTGLYMWFVYALFPFGLPRWCMLQPATTGSRKPSGFRGVPCATRKPPGDQRGYVNPAAPVGLPTALGLATTSSVGVVVGSSVGYAHTIVGVQYSIISAFGMGRRVVLQNDLLIPAPAGATGDFSVSENCHWPSFARELFLDMQIEFHNSGGSTSEAASAIHSVETTRTTGGPLSQATIPSPRVTGVLPSIPAAGDFVVNTSTVTAARPPGWPDPTPQTDLVAVSTDTGLLPAGVAPTQYNAIVSGWTI